MNACPMDGRPCPTCPTHCRFIHGDGDPSTAHDAQLAKARDAERVAREGVSDVA